MAENIFENLINEEQNKLWMFKIFDGDTVIEETEKWTKEAKKRGMTLAEYLESINPLNDKKETQQYEDSN